MLNFPDTPTTNQVFTSGALLWRWDGVKWVPGGAAPLAAVIVANTTTVLPGGYAGFVRVENSTAAPITITLPISPISGQEITIKDSGGNSSANAVTIDGNEMLIEGVPTIILSYNYSWVDLYFTGAQWVQV